MNTQVHGQLGRMWLLIRIPRKLMTGEYLGISYQGMVCNTQ